MNINEVFASVSEFKTTCIYIFCPRTWFLPKYCRLQNFLSSSILNLPPEYPSEEEEVLSILKVKEWELNHLTKSPQETTEEEKNFQEALKSQFNNICRCKPAFSFLELQLNILIYRQCWNLHVYILHKIKLMPVNISVPYCWRMTKIMKQQRWYVLLY